MAISKTMVSGSMTMLLLKLLSEKDMYGYEMISTLRQRSQNVFELKAGEPSILCCTPWRRRSFCNLMSRKSRGKCGNITALPREAAECFLKRGGVAGYAGAVTSVLGLEG